MLVTLIKVLGASDALKCKQWATEEYAVKHGIMKDIIFRLGGEQPVVDGFGTEINHRCPV